MGWSGSSIPYVASSSYPPLPASSSGYFPQSRDGPPWGSPWSSNHPDPWPHHHRTKLTTSHSPWPVASDNRSTTTTPAPKLPLPIPPTQHEKDLSTGALAAAIVVPILVFFSATALVYLCWRRRAQRQPVHAAPVLVGVAARSISGRSRPGSGIKEKLGSLRRHQPRHTPILASAAAADPPILMSEQNNAYYTGLDVDASSFGSRPTSDVYQDRASFEPPPPYIRDLSPPPPADGRVRSPFDDPPDHSLFTEDSYASDRRVSNPFVNPGVSPITPEGAGSDEDRRRWGD